MLKIFSRKPRGTKLALAGGITLLCLLGLMLAPASFQDLTAARGNAPTPSLLDTQLYHVQNNQLNMPNMSDVVHTSGAGEATNATVTFQHAPQGIAVLTYNQEAKTLEVAITMSGLEPNKVHQAHIHEEGNCSKHAPGKIKFLLGKIPVDGAGNVAQTIIFSNVQGGIPANNWFINVHSGEGPALNTEADNAAIVCGAISPTTSIASKVGNIQTVWVPLGPSSSQNENASGTATLQLVPRQQNKQMDLKITFQLQGLAPKSMHAVHIHAGTCSQTGKVLFHLDMQNGKMNPLQADEKGNIKNKTVVVPVGNITFIPTNWAINIHYSTDLQTQTGYNPVLCGNVIPKNN